MSGFLRCFRLARLAAGLAPQQMGSSGPLKLVLKVRFANWDHHEALAVRDVEKGKKRKNKFLGRIARFCDFGNVILADPLDSCHIRFAGFEGP